MIFVGQKIGLEGTITENGEAVDISGQTVAFDYWLPGNATETPDGEIPGSIVSGPDGTVEWTFPASLNTTAGEYLRVQAKVTISGDTYRAEATCVKIYPIGAC